ncbi:MAG: agmatinase family protein [Acidobacteria bacterium]|nr:agmatinase family protein [Acidobacteriota bacterium]
MKQSSFFDVPPAPDAGLFGYEYDPDHSLVVVIGVPWEPTVSYGRGTSQTPRALVPASHQLDLFDPLVNGSFGACVGMLPLNPNWLELNDQCCGKAAPIVAAGGVISDDLQSDLAFINACSEQLNRELKAEVTALLDTGKVVGILGGDHSSPYGSILAHFDRYPRMGVLHIDAHADLRVAYEGFLHSHASIMYNLIHEIPELSRLVSVGIRDYSEDEFRIAENHPSIRTYYDRDLKRQSYRGRTWDDVCREICDQLPTDVYVSFDVDGLNQQYCPHTGTPVPGGLSYGEAIHLLESVVHSGKRIIGFDLVEVVPNLSCPTDEWDLNVGARLLHKLCCLAYVSRR